MNALKIVAILIEAEQRARTAEILGRGAAMSAANIRFHWWRWTCWMALGITLRRIDNA